MPADPVTVAIPVRNGGVMLEGVLRAVARQRLDRPVELLVADSRSTDGSADLARRHGARVLDVPPGSFSHGGTRNRLMAEATGTHVAFLTQDSEPAADDWLATLLAGFTLADDVALVTGPYRPRPEASLPVRAELDAYFAAMSPDAGTAVIVRAPGDVNPDVPEPATFFSDANGCVARWAWERIPFREVAYAEDRLLAREHLRAGHAKAFDPRAAVLHSHDYGTIDLFRRCFDEWRGLREVFGYHQPARPRAVLRILREQLAVVGDRLALEGVTGGRAAVAQAGALRFLLVRAVGAALGSRADRLPVAVQRRCSLEGRAGLREVRL